MTMLTRVGRQQILHVLTAVALLGGLGSAVLAQDSQTATNTAPLNAAPAQGQPADSTNTTSDDGLTKQDQAQKDALFVYYLLISCAGAGTIISYVVWRSMPPRKPREDAKESS